MKKLMYFLICFPLLALAEGETGIKFDKESTWAEVQAKAKAQNKYIFVDCSTTWCGWCVKMDKETFSQEKVGKFFNENFIAVKVQMDTTPKDSEYVKKWYDDAAKMKETYKISGFPSYLYFSPDGKVVHREIGYKEADPFIAASKDAMDPGKQYYTLLDNYKAGKRDAELLPRMAKAAKATNDKDLAKTIADEYKKNHMDKLSDDKLFTDDNIKFVVGDFPDFMYEEGSKSKFFNYLYKNPAKVDEIMGRPNTANFYIKKIITKEEIDDKLWNGDKPVTPDPNWDAMHSSIKTKYTGEYADRLIAESQLTFYRRTGNVEKFVQAKDKQIEKYPPSTEVNQIEFNSTRMMTLDSQYVLAKAEDKALLGRALAWMDLCNKLESEKPDADSMHTRAKLLHKLGKTEEAIAYQEKNIAMVTERAKKADRDPVKATAELTTTLEKMKKGEPSWPVKK